MYRWWTRNSCSSRKGLSMDNKVAIVTGGTSGIGLATCNTLANEGYAVYAAARHQVDFIYENVFYHYVDVTDGKSCKKLFDDVVEKHGRIDVLVADAGITADALTVNMSDEQFDRVIDINIKGIFNIVRYVGPYMEKQGWGSIINVSSVVGEQGNIGQINYAASKGAIISMTKTWAKEFSRKGANVRVNAIAPGYIMTKMMDTVPQDLLDRFSSQTMLKRLGRPEEIAEVIAFLSSNKASYITGSVIDVNGGMRL